MYKRSLSDDLSILNYLVLGVDNSDFHILLMTFKKFLFVIAVAPNPDLQIELRVMFKGLS